MKSLSLTSSFLAVAPQRQPKSCKRNKISCSKHQHHVFSLSISCSKASEEAVRGTTELSSISTKLKNSTDQEAFLASDVLTTLWGFNSLTESLTEEPTTTNGIGILKFLSGKNFFVTGGTGFLAKAVIEKSVRGVPDVGKIFFLIKEKDKEVAMNRLQKEIIDSDLFESLRQMHGKSYQAFMSSKLIPIIENVHESELGMDAIAREIDVIINSAANTTFDERTLSTYELCKEVQKSLFSYMSQLHTLMGKGKVMEKPFYLGDSIARERNTVDNSTPISRPTLDVRAEIMLAMDTAQAFPGKEHTKMKELGLERARMYGWRNTYEFTKSMGEMLLNKMKGEIPLVIVRPSVILSTSKEPYPGWIQGNRMLDPLMLSYGKGHLPGFLVNPEAVIDVIPIDMVVNTIIAAIAKHGIASKPGMTVYHATSSVVNPLLLHDLFKFT